jgi:hypothetical protein
MLHKNLDITYSMVWSVALANILGAGMCYAFSPQFARLATLRFSLILPAVMGIIYIGAFEATRQWGDLFALLFFGVVGWLMKQFRWPRPPLILGAVLGDTIERYMFISVERYGISWFARPVVAILFIIAIIGLVRPLLEDIKYHGGIRKMATNFHAPAFHANQLFTIFMICVISSMVYMASKWDFSAKIVPLVVGSVALTALGFSLLNDMCRKKEAPMGDIADQTIHDIERRIGVAEGTGAGAAAEKMHLDIASDTAHLPVSIVAKRGLRFFGYLVAFMGIMSVIGLVPTSALFVVIFMRYENKERWPLVITYAIVLTWAVSFVFDNVMSIPWPPTLIGQWFPALKFLPSI